MPAPSRRLHPGRRHGRRLRPAHPAEDRGRGERAVLPRAAVRAPPPGPWRRRAGEPRRPVGIAPGRQPGRLQAAERGRDRGLSAQRRMARQGRRLCDPGPGGGADPLGLRLLFECRRAAALRDRRSCSPAAAIDRVGSRAADRRRPRRVARGAARRRACPSSCLSSAATAAKPAASISAGCAGWCRRSARRSSISATSGRPSCRKARFSRAASGSHEGERVIVQIRREAQGGKAARVTMASRLRGRLVELIVGRAGLRGWRGAARPTDRDRTLSAALRRVDAASGRGLGWGSGCSNRRRSTRLLPKRRHLARRWRDILDRAARLEPPARLDPVASFAAALAGCAAGCARRDPRRRSCGHPGTPRRFPGYRRRSTGRKPSGRSISTRYSTRRCPRRSPSPAAAPCISRRPGPAC